MSMQSIYKYYNQQGQNITELGSGVFGFPLRIRPDLRDIALKAEGLLALFRAATAVEDGSLARESAKDISTVHVDSMNGVVSVEDLISYSKTDDFRVGSLRVRDPENPEDTAQHELQVIGRVFTQFRAR